MNGLIRAQGWQIGNIDSVIVAEKPTLKPFLKLMRMKLSEVLVIETEKISIKATTNEKLGPIGNEQGIACYAVALLIRLSSCYFTWFRLKTPQSLCQSGDSFFQGYNLFQDNIHFRCH